MLAVSLDEEGGQRRLSGSMGTRTSSLPRPVLKLKDQLGGETRLLLRPTSHTASVSELASEGQRF